MHEVHADQQQDQVGTGDLGIAQQAAVALVTADWTVEEHAAELRSLQVTLAAKPLFADEIAGLVEVLAAAGARTAG